MMQKARGVKRFDIYDGFIDAPRYFRELMHAVMLRARDGMM